jgi:hypothetical protein
MPMLFLLQYYFANPQLETIPYSQFKELVRKKLVNDLVVTDDLVRGKVKPEGVREVLSQDQLKARLDDIKDGKKPLPFITIRAFVVNRLALSQAEGHRELIFTQSGGARKEFVVGSK